jgi:hypothetical protein
MLGIWDLAGLGRVRIDSLQEGAAHHRGETRAAPRSAHRHARFLRAARLVVALVLAVCCDDDAEWCGACGQGDG